jgi:hypothetical protein
MSQLINQCSLCKVQFGSETLELRPEGIKILISLVLWWD